MNRRTSLWAALAVYGVTVVSVVSAGAPRAARAQAPLSIPAVPHELVIKVPTSLSTKQLNDIVTGAGCRIVKPLAFSPGYYLLSLQTATTPQSPEAKQAARKPQPVAKDVTDAAAKLRTNQGVYASPNWVMKELQTAPPSSTTTIPNDPYFADQSWHMNQIRMPEAWAIQVGARPIIAAVIDSGIDPNHPDFAGRILPQSIDVTPDIPTNTLSDQSGHGTHVAGTVAAATNNSLGVTGVGGWQKNGVDIKLLVIKASGFTSDGSTGFANDDLIESVNYAAAQRADVVNMSLGGVYGFDISGDPLNQAIIAAVNSGTVFVVAKGNSNTGLLTYPADYPEVIGVSAVGPSGTKSDYSNYGGNTTIAAPGGEGFRTGEVVLSTVPLNLAGFYGVAGYDLKQGTSMASPHVAGAVALLMAAGLPAANVRAQLTSTAKAIPDTSGQNFYGAGLLDVYSALLPLTDPIASFVGGRDVGSSFTPTRAFNLQLTNVAKLESSPSSVTVEVRTATEPSSLIRTFVGGVDFDIPTTGAGEFAAAPKVTQVPRNGDLTVANGRYKAIATVNFNGKTTTSQQFFSITSRRQPLGRVMFATPFQTTAADSANAEKALFGDISFRLKRYEPLNITGGVAGDGYFTYSSAGDPQEAKASFKATGDDNAPLVFDTAAPNVSIAPIGLGYWLDLSETRDLNPVGTTYPNSAVGIRLFAAGSGWNMIGAPFTAPVDWGTVTVRVGAVNYTLAEAVDRQIISSVLVGFTEGDYTYFVAPQGVLDPFNGYWVRAFQDCTLVVPPNFSGGSSVTGRSQHLAATPVGEGWRVRLMASVGGDRDGQNYFGQTRGAANDANDRADIQKPPSGSGHAYLRFLQNGPEGRAAGYAFDMRAFTGASVTRQKWTAAVSTDKPNADVSLSWDGLTRAPRQAKLTIKDMETGTVVPLRSRSSYTFRSGKAGATRLFEISLEPQASGGSLAITNLTMASTGRGTNSGGVAVRFTATQDAEITGLVTTLSGKTVSTLTGPTRAVGSTETTLRWSGRAQDGASVPVGPYLIELRARSADGQVTTVKRPFQNMR